MKVRCLRRAPARSVLSGFARKQHHVVPVFIDDSTGPIRSFWPSDGALGRNLAAFLSERAPQGHMKPVAPNCEILLQGCSRESGCKLVDVTGLSRQASVQRGRPRSHRASSPAFALSIAGDQERGHWPRALFRSRNGGPVVGGFPTELYSSILSGHSVRAMSQKRHSWQLGTFQAGSEPAMTSRKYSKALMNFWSTASGGMSIFEPL